jgi:hypothetical protein
MEGVNGTEGCVFADTSGSVFIERDGRRLARRRLDVGGRREGEVLRERERPGAVFRVGGRNEGELPSTPLNILTTPVVVYSYIAGVLLIVGEAVWGKGGIPKLVCSMLREGGAD